MPIQRSVVFAAALALLIVSLHSVVAAPLAQNGLPGGYAGGNLGVDGAADRARQQ